MKYLIWIILVIPAMRLSQAFGEYTGNPYNTVNRGQFNEFTESKLFTDLVFDQKLNIITEGLSFKGKVSLNTFLMPFVNSQLGIS
jgi:hypothetical protein